MPQWGLSSTSQFVMLDGMETLGARIRRVMDGQRPAMTGRMLATAIGKDPSYISKLINDQLKETPPPDVLRCLDRVLGIPVPWSLRALGYALDDDAGPAQPFAPGSPAAELVGTIAALPEREVLLLLKTAREFREWEEADHGQRSKRQSG